MFQYCQSETESLSWAVFFPRPVQRVDRPTPFSVGLGCLLSTTVRFQGSMSILFFIQTTAFFTQYRIHRFFCSCSVAGILFIGSSKRRVVSRLNKHQMIRRFQFDLRHAKFADQIETSTSPRPRKPRAFELLKIGSFKFPTLPSDFVCQVPLPKNNRCRFLSSVIKLVSGAYE